MGVICDELWFDKGIRSDLLHSHQGRVDLIQVVLGDEKFILVFTCNKVRFKLFFFLQEIQQVLLVNEDLLFKGPFFIGNVGQGTIKINHRGFQLELVVKAIGHSIGTTCRNQNGMADFLDGLDDLNGVVAQLTLGI